MRINKSGRNLGIVTKFPDAGRSPEAEIRRLRESAKTNNGGIDFWVHVRVLVCPKTTLPRLR